MKEMETGMLQEVYVCMHIMVNVWRRSVVVCFPLDMKYSSFSIKKTLRGRMVIYYQKNMNVALHIINGTNIVSF